MNRPNSNDLKDGVRTDRILVEVSVETAARLREAAILTQQLANRAYLEWHAWHLAHGSVEIVKEFVRNFEPWKCEESEIFRRVYQEHRESLGVEKLSEEQKKAAGKEARKLAGTPPKCPIYCLDRESEKAIRDRLVGAFPDLHSKVLGAAIKKLFQDLKTHKASKGVGGNARNFDGRLKRWHLILADLGEAPNFSRMQPIPLKKEAFEIERPGDAEDETAEWFAVFRVDRFPSTTAAGNPKADSHQERVKLVTYSEANKRKPKGLVKIRRTLQRCTDGTWGLCGPSIVERDGRWYLHLAYRVDRWRKVNADFRKKAFLEPDAEYPWRLVFPDKTFTTVMRRYGRIVAWQRERLSRKRATLGQAKRGGKRKGHGRGRAHEREARLDAFKQTFSRQTVAGVLRILEDRRIGTLIYRRPTWGQEHTFLARAGVRQGAESWCWEFVENEFKRQCQRLGFRFSTEDFDATSVGKKSSGE